MGQLTDSADIEMTKKFVSIHAEIKPIPILFWKQKNMWSKRINNQGNLPVPFDGLITRSCELHLGNFLINQNMVLGNS